MCGHMRSAGSPAPRVHTRPAALPHAERSLRHRIASAADRIARPPYVGREGGSRRAHMRMPLQVRQQAMRGCNLASV